jgi:hypothetical protein
MSVQWDDSKETWGQFMQRCMPLAEKWWDEEQVQLDLTTVQEENDTGLKWDQLDHDGKRELLMKIGYGSKQANGILLNAQQWKTCGSKLKNELRKLGVIDPPGTVLHEGRQLWKYLSIPERRDVFNKWFIFVTKNSIKKLEEDNVKEMKKLEKMKKEGDALEKRLKRKSWFGL